MCTSGSPSRTYPRRGRRRRTRGGGGRRTAPWYARRSGARTPRAGRPEAALRPRGPTCRRAGRWVPGDLRARAHRPTDPGAPAARGTLGPLRPFMNSCRVAPGHRTLHGDLRNEGPSLEAGDGTQQNRKHGAWAREVSPNPSPRPSTGPRAPQLLASYGRGQSERGSDGALIPLPRPRPRRASRHLSELRRLVASTMASDSSKSNSASVSLGSYPPEEAARIFTASLAIWLSRIFS